MHSRSWVIAAAASIASMMTATSVLAQVTGKVTLKGDAPEARQIDMSAVAECQKQHADAVYEETFVVGDNGALKNVIVSIKKEDSPDLTGEVPKEPVVLDQKGCQYVPHVLPMMVGQEFHVRNDDPFLHNVHSLSQTNPAFNFGQPNKDPGKKVDPMKAPEYFRVKCDVHPWMTAYIAVFAQPHFAATGDDASFEIKHRPDGDYTIVFWHEKMGSHEEKVTVKDGKGEVNYEFTAEGSTGPDVQKTVPVAASGDCASKGACCEATAKGEGMKKTETATSQR